MAAFRLIGALEPGTTITSLEGVDLKGEKAVIVDLSEGGKGKQVVTLYFPRLKATKRYKVPSVSVTKTVKGPGKKINPEGVDELRLNSPGRSTLPMRENLPDSTLPPDPSGPSTLTDVLTRPTIRRTMGPRLYNFRSRLAAAYGSKKEQARLETWLQESVTGLRKHLLKIGHILRAYQDDLQPGTWELIDREKHWQRAVELYTQIQTIQAQLKKLG